MQIFVKIFSLIVLFYLIYFWSNGFPATSNKCTIGRSEFLDQSGSIFYSGRGCNETEIDAREATKCIVLIIGKKFKFESLKDTLSPCLRFKHSIRFGTAFTTLLFSSLTDNQYREFCLLQYGYTDCIFRLQSRETWKIKVTAMLSGLGSGVVEWKHVSSSGELKKAFPLQTWKQQTHCTFCISLRCISLCNISDSYDFVCIWVLDMIFTFMRLCKYYIYIFSPLYFLGCTIVSFQSGEKCLVV